MADKSTPAAKPRPFDCLSCGYFQVGNADHPENGGTCRRYPPVPVLIGMQQPIRGAQPQPLVPGYWPVVGKGDWCGEHTSAALNFPLRRQTEEVAASSIAPPARA